MKRLVIYCLMVALGLLAFGLLLPGLLVLDSSCFTSIIGADASGKICYAYGNRIAI